MRPSLGRRSLPLIVVATLLAAQPASAQPTTRPAGTSAEAQDLGVVFERVERLEPLGERRRVMVRNDFGNIRARFGGYGDAVEIRAVLQHFDDEGPRLEVETSRGEGALSVTVGHRGASGALDAKSRDSWRKRVDLVLFVPDGVSLESHTTDGLTEIKGLRGDVTARSADGEIIARSVDGELDLESATGHVLAVPKSPVGRLPHRVRSGGEVTLYLFDDADVTLEATARGPVSTDFSIDLRRRGDAKRVGLELGKGTTPLEVDAGGPLRLVRKPAAERARPRRGEVTTPDAGEPPERRDLPLVGDGHGDVELRAVAGESLEARTLTGDITLWIDDGSYAVELATSGEITVEDPIDIDYRYHGEPSKKGSITLGSGETTIRLESRRGAIRVLREP